MPELWFQHWLDLIAKYGRERFGRDIPMDKLKEEPMWKIVGWRDSAWAYFKMNDHYFSLDEVPESSKDGRMVYIRGDGVTYAYDSFEGKWRFYQEVEDKLYKG